MFQLRLSECFWVLTVCSPGLITSIYTTMAGDSSGQLLYFSYVCIMAVVQLTHAWVAL